jgi:hypothetical protein
MLKRNLDQIYYFDPIAEQLKTSFFKLSVPIGEQFAKHYFLALHQHSRSFTRKKWTEANRLSEIVSHALSSANQENKKQFLPAKGKETQKTILKLLGAVDNFSIPGSTSTSRGLTAGTINPVVKPQGVVAGMNFQHSLDKDSDKDNKWLQCQKAADIEKQLLLVGQLLHQANIRTSSQLTVVKIKQEQEQNAEQKVPYVGDLSRAQGDNPLLNAMNQLKQTVMDAISGYQAKKAHETSSFSYLQAGKLQIAVNKASDYVKLKEIVLAFLNNDKLKTKLSIPLFKTADSDPLCHGLKMTIAGKIQTLANQDADLIAVAAALVGGFSSLKLG